jgi:site-specific recombinase XerC
MASPFTAEIIPFSPARAPARDSLPPAPVTAPVATRRYLRHLDADDIARLLDGTDYGEPEVVRRP